VKPDDKVQRNFTDPDSRIMKAPGKHQFIQGYNVQIAVDGRDSGYLGYTRSSVIIGYSQPYTHT